MLMSRSQGYGSTETNSIAVGVAGEDYVSRPASTSVTVYFPVILRKMTLASGLPMPVNDVIIVKDNVVLPPNQIGEVWM